MTSRTGHQRCDYWRAYIIYGCNILLAQSRVACSPIYSTLSCGILEAFVRFLNWSMRSDNSFVAGTRLLQNILPFPSKSHMRPVYLSTLFMFCTTVVDNLMYRASSVQGEGNMGKWKPALSCSNNRNGIYWRVEATSTGYCPFRQLHCAFKAGAKRKKEAKKLQYIRLKRSRGCAPLCTCLFLHPVAGANNRKQIFFCLILSPLILLTKICGRKLHVGKLFC